MTWSKATVTTSAFRGKYFNNNDLTAVAYICRYGLNDSYWFDLQIYSLLRSKILIHFLKGKTPEDTRKRYQKLLFDIARIENGEEVELLYSPGLIEGEVDGGEKKGKEGEVIVYNEV